MIQDLSSLLIPMLIAVAMSYLYVLAIEKNREREQEEAENIKQGFQKISW